MISQLVDQNLHLQIKAPFRDSLFPYKNEKGVLIQTPMQFSTSRGNSTFLTVDFSQFSSSEQVKIEQSEIDNLKALKVFVEDGQTIYRW